MYKIFLEVICRLLLNRNTSFKRYTLKCSSSYVNIKQALRVGAKIPDLYAH